MNENFNSLFQYLEKEDIKVDKVEFLFQIQSHPDYPSILAIADALTFFNIQSGVVRVDVSEIELLSERFIALLIEEKSKPSGTHLYFVEQKDNKYYYTKDKKAIEISKSELESRWNGIVLLIEKDETEHAINTKENNLFWVLPSLCIGLFLSVLFMVQENFTTKSFFIFPIIGILFSVAALKDLFGAKSELISNFCNITASTSCTTVVNSDKWKIFRFLNFSDLSMVFFASQFFGLFILLLSRDTITFFSIQKIMLLFSLPVILLSLYYQRFVERKWCPICLVIIWITILELIYLVLFQNNDFTISYKPITIFGLVSSIILLAWLGLKRILLKQKELKEFQLTSNRFMRNYEIFKNSLTSEDYVYLPNSPILLGNKESNTEITIITSPFCGHCESVHKILEKILDTNHENIKIKVLISPDIDKILNEEKKTFFRILLSIYFEKGEVFFQEALNYWFEIKNLKDWIKAYELPFDSELIDSIYRQQNQWCKNNDFTFTPVIFVNGYQYPKTYNRESLEFFINELLEDDSFIKESMEEVSIEGI